MRVIDRYDGFVFDLDGTVYLGDSLLPGARAVVTEIRRSGKALVYLTNKPLEPSSAYAERLTTLGLPTAPEDVVSSLDSLVLYMSLNHPTATVLCVSEPLVADRLRAAGHEVTGDALQAEVVVVSFDRTFDYTKLHAAYVAVAAGAALVATNPDAYCPTPDGGLPDCAAMLAAIEACTGAKAEAVVGKPSEHMASALTQRLGMSPGRVLLAGDRIETDVAMASRAGLDSALVLTGATRLAHVQKSAFQPTYVIESLQQLLLGAAARTPHGPEVK